MTHLHVRGYSSGDVRPAGLDPWPPAPPVVAPRVPVRGPAPPSLAYASFEVHAETKWGDTLYVVGSHPQLGNWIPENGLRMMTDHSSYPRWRCTIGLPAPSDATSELPDMIEYKFVNMRGGGPACDWEPLEDNRRALIRYYSLPERAAAPDTPTLVVTARWGVISDCDTRDATRQRAAMLPPNNLPKPAPEPRSFSRAFSTGTAGGAACAQAAGVGGHAVTRPPSANAAFGWTPPPPRSCPIPIPVTDSFDSHRPQGFSATGGANAVPFGANAVPFGANAVPFGAAIPIEGVEQSAHVPRVRDRIAGIRGDALAPITSLGSTMSWGLSPVNSSVDASSVKLHGSHCSLHGSQCSLPIGGASTGSLTGLFSVHVRSRSRSSEKLSDDSHSKTVSPTASNPEGSFMRSASSTLFEITA